MSSFYDDASLVMIPSCYKTSTVLCEKPTDGSGDLTFTRTGDTATRVNSSGLVEKVRTNRLLQSQTFDNASWIKSNITVTANSTNAPDGTATADTILAPTTSVNAIYQAISTSGVLTLSIYAKANTSNFVYIDLFDASPATDYVAIFNLSNGTYVGNGGFSSVDSYNIQSVGNGWYRISATKDLGASGNHNFVYGVSNGSGITATAGTSVFVWGAQLETGDIATAYIPTTTAAVSVGPVANLARLDYLNSSCPRLLLEPQRTNLVTYSEQFNNAAWTKQAVTVTANAAISPDGYTNADNIVPTAVSGTHQVFTGALVTSSQCAMSVYAKANGYTTFQMLDITGTNGALFNLANGTVTNTGSGVGTITSVGNGWYRCTAVATTTGIRFYVPTASGTFTGDGTSGVLLWGAQLEVGSFATSYIPTLAASATRSAESSSSANISSLFGATEGSFYVQLTHDGRNTNNAIPVFLRSSINGNFNRATYLQFGATNLTLNVYDAGTLQAAISGGTYTNGQTLKVAFAYKANDFALYVNGVQLGTDTSGAISSSLSFIDFGSYMLAQSTFQYDGKVSQALLFKTRLTNAQLAELTTI